MPDIMLIGEAPGEQEALTGLPFVGPAGQELTRMLKAAGINRNECSLTNVFLDRPRDNNVENFCGDFLDAKTAYTGGGYERLRNSDGTYPWPAQYSFSPIKRGTGRNYVLPQYLSVLPRIRAEIAAVRPRVVVALGNVALWALTNSTGISKARGKLLHPRGADYSILPTYHPSAVLRDWSLRVTTILDLIKARRAAAGEVRPFAGRVFVAETPDDLHLPPFDKVAIDVETAHRQITSVSLSPSADHSLVIPFVDKSRPGYSYWPTLREETLAWQFIETVMRTAAVKIFHNSLYDLTYLCHCHGLRCAPPVEDTMLIHHALFPEVSKSLDHLASIYTDRPAWKHLRHDTGKREDE